MTVDPTVYRPRLFVVSSTETLPEARLLRARLADDAHLVVWADGVFRVGDMTLDRLAAVLSPGRFDGAVIVAGADDLAESRGTTSEVPRDNVILEMGMALSAFGPERTFTVVENVPKRLKLPSDLLGWTTTSYVSGNDKSRMDAAADDIRAAVADVAWEFTPPSVREACKGLLGIASQRLQLELSPAPGMGLHLWLTHRTERGTLLRRVARSRTKLKTQKYEAFERGAGIVGYTSETETITSVNFREPPYCDSSGLDWDTQPDEVRAGMHFELLETSRKRYSRIKAIPIFSTSANRQLLGILSVNVEHGAIDVDLDAGVVDQLLEECAAVLGHLLESHNVGMMA